MQSKPIIKFSQDVIMVIPGGCGALNNDTRSQEAITTATAVSMGIEAEDVIYTGCNSSDVTRRRLADGSGGQSVAAGNLITVPMQRYASAGSSAEDAEILYNELQVKMKNSLSSGNFTKTLKTASISLGARVTANVNSTALGKTSALVLIYPPTSAPTARPTPAPVKNNKASSSEANVGLIVGVVVAAVVLIVAVVTGWYFLVFSSGATTKMGPGGVKVPPLSFNQQVYPIDTGAGARQDIVDVNSPPDPESLATVSTSYFLQILVVPFFNFLFTVFFPVQGRSVAIVITDGSPEFTPGMERLRRIRLGDAELGNASDDEDGRANRLAYR